MRQFYDDGTWIDFDSAGSIVQYSNTDGSVFTPERNIFENFLRQIAPSIANKINSTLNPAPITAQSGMTMAGGTLQQMIPLLLLGVAGFVAYRSFAK